MQKRFLLLTLAFASLGNAQGNPEVVAKVIELGKSGNQTRSHLEYLCEQIGHRLTGSSNLQRACDWTAAKFKEFGCQNVRLEQWGEIPVGFDRGTHHVGRMVSPNPRNFEFTTRSWTAGTGGPRSGGVFLEPTTVEDVAKAAPRGKWMLMLPRQGDGLPPRETREAVLAAARAEGIHGTVAASRNELVITSGSWNNLDFENLPKDVDVTVRKSDFDAVTAAMQAGGMPVLEFDLDQKFVKGPIPVYNVIAEIPGVSKPDEIVIVSGHLDSWDGPGSQGTCDNGTGTMVALEAARLLMAAGAKPERTIRFILWTGEEQGLWGSRKYVEMHPDELANISAVIVDDGGTNYCGGLVGTEAMKPMLEQAIAPLAEAFPDLPMTIRGQAQMPQGGGSDHASFNRAGVPGFFWMETGVADYNYIHHTQHDKLVGAIHRYLVQSSVASAVTAYNLACAPTMLPRQGG
ncbi:MAG: M28 family metallopeptidase [Fimbriimonadaceae bacterium]